MRTLPTSNRVLRQGLLSGAACGLALVLAGCGDAPRGTARSHDAGVAVGAPSEQIRALTGARTRLVWVQDQEDQGDFVSIRNQTKVMGLDTDDGRGEREVWAEAGYFTKPLITPKGDRVVFSDFKAAQVHVVNWDGTGHKVLRDGCAMEVWLDPANGIEWVYVQTGPLKDKEFEKNPVWRYQLDNPAAAELVWDKTAVSWHGNFQLSADGTKASGLFPWPQTGLAELPNKSWKKLGSGCWTALAPDDSYLCWKFDGQHRNVRIMGPGDLMGRKVNVNNAPGIDGHEVYHPRWTSHARFVIATGPYIKRGPNGEKMGPAGPFVEVYLGRFDSDFTSMDAWVKVTRNDKGDFFPDAWIAADGAEQEASAKLDGSADGNGSL
jgi:hypothetical protein